MIRSVIDTKSNRASYTTIPKLCGSAERDIEIARVRVITLGEVFSHDDHLLTSHLFDGTLPMSHVAQLEAYLIDVGVGTEYNYNVIL